ncbi:hypothetical protein SBOR_9114 [Sclerotinia borealis F-4128]|uniref:Borealin N-terminal domain-containing protein n=1 Tax=Sclerotinia borealis (strain F-4128) TaxID=1432307 RepID=W9C123_SCLBF|nr:hypothetical protein SBOR_9114 [Sclerotinia borealis F-4128]
MAITSGQKQAVMENLQLEITERARKLRAQYNVQAQGLKTRIEIRVNRIPITMRKRKIGDLFDKHNNTGAHTARNEVGPPVPPKNTQKKIPVEESESGPSTQVAPSRAIKRNSAEASLDKENNIENPKKRQKAAPILPERTTARVNMNPKQILSPRSANSRTLPASPLKSAPPAKPIAVSRPSTRQGRKIAPHTNPAGAAPGRGRSANSTLGPNTTRGRNASNTSTETVIVKKAPAAKLKKTAPPQSTQPASTAIGRVLRKRA